MSRNHVPKDNRRFPELNYFDNPQDRVEALVQATKSALRRGAAGRKLCFHGLAVAAVVLIAIYLPVQQSVPLPPWAVVLLLSTLSYIVLETFFRGQYVDAVRKDLRVRLLRLGAPICVKCGYDLRGQVEARCPACGSAFDATLLRNDREESGTEGNRKSVAPKGEDNES